MRADGLHRVSVLYVCVCVWATRPFECDEWAVDIAEGLGTAQEDGQRQ